MKQGEKIKCIGKILSRQKGSTQDFEQLSSLDGINIYLSLTKAARITKQLIVNKVDNYFYTSTVSTVDMLGEYEIEAAIKVGDDIIIASDRQRIFVEQSPLGLKITDKDEIIDDNIDSYKSNTLLDGDFEYRIELAITGSEFSFDNFNNYDDTLLFSLGTILKGDSVNIYYSDSREEAIENSKNDLNNFYVWD